MADVTHERTRGSNAEGFIFIIAGQRTRARSSVATSGKVR